MSRHLRRGLVLLALAPVGLLVTALAWVASGAADSEPLRAVLVLVALGAGLGGVVAAAVGAVLVVVGVLSPPGRL